LATNHPALASKGENRKTAATAKPNPRTTAKPNETSTTATTATSTTATRSELEKKLFKDLQLANARVHAVSKRYRGTRDAEIDILRSTTDVIMHGSNVRWQKAPRIGNIWGTGARGTKRKAQAIISQHKDLAVICGPTKKARLELQQHEQQQHNALALQEQKPARPPPVPRRMQYAIACDSLASRNQIARVWSVSPPTVVRSKNAMALSILDAQNHALEAIREYFRNAPTRARDPAAETARDPAETAMVPSFSLDFLAEHVMWDGTKQTLSVNFDELLSPDQQISQWEVMIQRQSGH